MSVEDMDKRLSDLDGKKVSVIGWRVMEDDTNKKFAIKAGMINKFRDGYLLTHLQPKMPMDFYRRSEIGWLYVYQIKEEGKEFSPIDPSQTDMMVSVDAINISIPE